MDGIILYNGGSTQRVDSQEPKPPIFRKLKPINMEEKYTIICSMYTYGQVTECVTKNQVRSECERLKKVCTLGTDKCYQVIEVINNQTGEIREYWNNIENKIQF